MNRVRYPCRCRQELRGSLCGPRTIRRSVCKLSKNPTHAFLSSSQYTASILSREPTRSTLCVYSRWTRPHKSPSEGAVDAFESVWSPLVPHVSRSRSGRALSAKKRPDWRSPGADRRLQTRVGDRPKAVSCGCLLGKRVGFSCFHHLAQLLQVKSPQATSAPCTHQQAYLRRECYCYCSFIALSVSYFGPG